MRGSLRGPSSVVRTQPRSLRFAAANEGPSDDFKGFSANFRTGRVRIGGATVKPAKDVRVGDLVEIEIERIVWQVEVLGVCDVRGPASVAQTLYAETADSQAKRAAELERRKTFHEPAAALHGRPTKRDRRVIDKFSGGD